MNSNEVKIDYERERDGYKEFLSDLKTYFEIASNQNKALYYVNAEGLWDAFLNNLPEDARQHYNCRTCRHFVERYGNIVAIGNNGNIESALWGGYVPDFFTPSVNAMNKIVKKVAKVNGVFISDVRTLGTPETGVWEHMSVTLPREKVNTSRVKNASQLMAEKLEDFKMLFNAINEYPSSVVEQATVLLQTNAMYRSDRVLGVAKWFKELHENIAEVNGVYRTNLIWKAVGEAPTGFCHIKSSMIGTLLDDIKAGYSTRVVMARFEEKMNPQNYMRSQSAPTASAVEQAEKLVEKMGIADSLRRRYAHFDEIVSECMWTPKNNVNKTVEKKTGVFANVVTKEKQNITSNNLEMPTTVMTWEKFVRTILPSADNLAVRVENSNRFMALVTEAVKDSENILQWDNPFSWYYHGGIDGEIKRRVEAAGGRYDNCEIRCSLIWESYTDLDIHCILPNGSHIYFGNKKIGNGWLDVDANGGHASTMTPVENIRWIDNAPNGHYKFYVHNYADRNHGNNPYKVELEICGQIYTYNGFMNGTGEKKTVFEFDYNNGVVSNMNACGANVSNSEMWNLTMNQFVDVKGIVKSPNMWGKNSNSTNGNHTFFILDGCKDTSEGLGRGFFNEILKPELREIRKTLEVYSANTPIEDIDNADACGVGFSTDSDWNVVIKVSSGNNSRLIKIDRFD